MRHNKKGRKLGTDASHTKAIKKSLIANLFLNDRIKTTLERAKEIRGDVDRVITWAKRGDVHSRRLAIAKVGDKDLVAEIFAKVAQGMFEGRPGGYTRIMRLGMRRGDSATIVIMELVQEPVSKKAAADKGETKKPAAAKADKATKAAAVAEAVEVEAETVVEAEAVAEKAVTEETPAAEEASDTAEAVAEDAAEAVAEEAAAEEAPAEESEVKEDSESK